MLDLEPDFDPLRGTLIGWFRENLVEVIIAVVVTSMVLWAVLP